MSFFGFDASRHNPSAPGFSQANDPFAGLSNHKDTDDALEFEDTYDGLGDALEETGDAFNDDTFGGGANDAFGGSAKVGNDFDFFGQTAKVSDAIEEEHARFSRLQPMSKASVYAEHPAAVSRQGYDFVSPSSSRPARSGYEKYKEPEPEMRVDAALWGVAPKKPATQQAASAAPSRKVMSLEEVEAAMRAQSKKPSGVAAQPSPVPIPSPGYQQPFPVSGPPQGLSEYGYAAPPSDAVPQPGFGHPLSILQRPQSQHTPPAISSPGQVPPQYQQAAPQQPPQQVPPQQPVQILQNPNRRSGGEAVGSVPQSYPGPPAHQRQQSSFSMPTQIITHPSQLANLSDEEKAAYLEQEAKRAKRNHKIFILSKDNGLMTPQDKNFVTRIQLQQLVSATGNPNEHGTDEALKEDFYYQVLSQIRGSSRQHPSQPLNNFAQTYLFQTGSRFHSRRFLNRERGAENHMQRMEQQVQRAVEAAKNRPKNKQLVIEGTLGKISFSNAKTPKPLLNIKRAEGSNGTGSSGDAAHRPGSGHKTTHSGPTSRAVDRKSVLSSIEKVYATLMELEDHSRSLPPQPADPSDLEAMQRQVEWSEASQKLNAQLWRDLKVHEPIGEYPVHPFIAFLSFAKGKKAIPRVFRQLSHELRATVLTIIVVHLDQLDVVRNAQVNNGEEQLNVALREKIELFQATVVNTLFLFMVELNLDLVTGVLGLITNLKVDIIAKSRIGTAMITMILSRAAIIKQNGDGTAQQWQNWEIAYNNLFNILEPTLPYMFPGTVTSGDDMYVWQLLAALGISASPDQQQRLVLAVKDRVMQTVSAANALPVDLATPRLQNVNLFMHSIGLDVELLQ